MVKVPLPVCAKRMLAKNRNLSPEGYEGGLLIDEMTIQQDIQFSKKLFQRRPVDFLSTASLCDVRKVLSLSGQSGKQDFVKEVWSKSENENYCISLVRSRNCIVALNYTSLHTTPVNMPTVISSCVL
jgi:hypothetical protein